MPNLIIPSGSKLPDNHQWTNRFQVKSASSNKLYTIAQNKNRRHWGCSCPGWIFHRSCKHLAVLGLPSHERPFEVTVNSAKPVVKELVYADYEEAVTNY